MFVKDIMSKKVFSVSPNDKVQNFISFMESKHIHEVPVLEKGRVRGMIRFKTLASKGITDPTKQKISSLMDFPPPKISPDDSIEDAADVLFKTGLRALPVTDKKKVVGMISSHDIIDVASRTKEFRQTKAESVMSIGEVILEDDDIGKARVLMREKHISRVPVVDRKGKLAGIVTVFDLLKAIKRPRERMSWYNMAAEMERIVAMPVSNIMNNHPPVGKRKDSLNTIVNKMIKHRTAGITITDSGIPVGMVTLKDLLEIYVAGLQEKGVYYHAIGLTGEDAYITETIHRMIGDSLNKISKIYPIQFLFVHFKKYQYKGLNAKWSVRVRIMTDAGLFITKAHAWDPRDAARLALGHLERILTKRRKEMRTSVKKRATRMKSIRKGK